MKEYTLINRRNPKEVIRLKRETLTLGQIKEINRDGYEIVAIKTIK